MFDCVRLDDLARSLNIKCEHRLQLTPMTINPFILIGERRHRGATVSQIRQRLPIRCISFSRAPLWRLTFGDSSMGPSCFCTESVSLSNFSAPARAGLNSNLPGFAGRSCMQSSTALRYASRELVVHKVSRI